MTTRRLRVVKYRGSAHGTNEYPFLIDDLGISVLPITSAGLGHTISQEAVPPGSQTSTRCSAVAAIIGAPVS